MADETILPSTLKLALTQQGSTLPGATHTQSVSAFALALTLPTLIPVISFPTISRKPSHDFAYEPSDDAVLLGDTASGYPLPNKLFTFDSPTFVFEYRITPQADKLIIMAFYQNYKDREFPWYNDQDDTWYTVCFAAKPRCRIDGRKDLWRILVMFRQCLP